jgi:hypothetical protein
LIQHKIGKHCPAGDPDRIKHLIIACDIFERLEARYGLVRTRETLRFENEIGRLRYTGGLFNNSAVKP